MRRWLWRNEASYLHATKQELVSVVLKCCARIWRVNPVCIVQVAMVKGLRIWTGGPNLSRQLDLSAVSNDVSYELNKSLLWFSLRLFALKQHHPVVPSSWHWVHLFWNAWQKHCLSLLKWLYALHSFCRFFLHMLKFQFLFFVVFLSCFSQCPLIFPLFFSPVFESVFVVLRSCLVHRCCAVPQRLIVWCLWW